MKRKKNQMNKLYKLCALLLSLAAAAFCISVSAVTVKADDSVTTASVSDVTGSLVGYGCIDGSGGGESVGGMAAKGTIKLEGNIDDSLIDSSNATVSLLDGTGYSASDLNLSYELKIGQWEYGLSTFNVSGIALSWKFEKEWETNGGDGSGHYTFTLQVSGITYNGKGVDGATFNVEIYIFSLASTITNAEALTESDYTAGSWSVLQTALASAKTVAADGSATLAEMYEATDALNTAIASLVKAADTTALTTAIGSAEALAESDYTADSWSVLQTALASAKTVVADANAQQADVDAATDALKAAIASLVKAADSAYSTGDTEDTTDDTEDTTDDTEDSAESSTAVNVSPAQTGDDTMIALWFSALAMSIVTVIILWEYRRRIL